MKKKDQIKDNARTKQGGKCEFSETPLPKTPKLYDGARKTPKRKGGKFNKENVVAVDPVVNMIKNGNWREREGLIEDIKKIIDEREHAMKLLFKVSNQVDAYKRYTDQLNEKFVEFLDDQTKLYKKMESKITRNLIKKVQKLSEIDPLVKAALSVRGIGPATIAYCVAYLDFSKGRHASSFWKYAGLDRPSHERYIKGEISGGNRRLRVALYRLADSQVKLRGVYRDVYDNRKKRLESSEKITKTYIGKDKLVEKAWKDVSDGHRHGACMRLVMKHFLADYWYAGRELMGLDTTPLYPEAHLNSTHKTIMPKERGWIY